MVALAIKCLPNKRRTDFPKHVAKRQMSYGCTYTSFDELKRNIAQWIEYYNTKRIKQKLGWLSPVEYRLTTMQHKKKAQQRDSCYA